MSPKSAMISSHKQFNALVSGVDSVHTPHLEDPEVPAAKV